MFPILLLFSTIFAQEVISPKLGYCVHDQYLKNMPSSFSPLNEKEKATDWGREYSIALSFAKNLDLYQAITAFKRSSILIPDTLIERRREIDYQIILSYYLGGQYKLAKEFFDHSLLANIEPSFPAFHDLLIIVYDCLRSLNETERTSGLLRIINEYFPYEKKKLDMSTAIICGDTSLIQNHIQDNMINTSIASMESSLNSAFLNQGKDSNIDHTHNNICEEKLKSLYHLKDCHNTTIELFDEYNNQRKNPYLAGGLNTLLPGLGYLYLGQKQSAFTAFCINMLTLSTAYYFYQNDNLPASFLALGFESGWYFGGIYGAAEEAEFFNKRSFEKAAHFRMRDHKLYPILMLNHGF